MMDGMNLLVLICAVIAALAFGVLLAYGCCQALFGLLKAHVRSLSSGPGGAQAGETSVPQVQTAS